MELTRMTAYPTLTLKKGKEANVAFRHPWIFSGALEKPAGELPHGALVRVADMEGRILGTGTSSSRSSIAVRVFEFGEAEIDKAWIEARIREAETRRRLLGYGPGTETTGYRAVFGEADGLPGLVVDRYGDAVVFQIATAGLEALRADILSAIQAVFEPKAIVERSDLPVREEEGLGPVVEMHLRDASPSIVEFTENGLRFRADLARGQKTGFFLDQKDVRARLRKLAKGRSVLNLFSYSGASGVYAMAGGAERVLNVDASKEALELCAAHAVLNGLASDRFPGEEADVFQWLGAKSGPDFGMVVLDPPALIKSRKDLENGAKAYHFLNRAAMRLVEDGGIFAASSCSHFLPEEDLAFILRRASVQAGIRLDVLEVVRQSPDHPLSVYFPESSYLKTFICRVKR
jgi:23S rRNA (cytosine1962-C5)-methyltransferase